jgi:hypothetical protein
MNKTIATRPQEEMTTRWFVEGATNPSVLRIHVTDELTLRTIETCPPGVAPRPLDRLLQVPGVRSIDLHRYRAGRFLGPSISSFYGRHSLAEHIGIWRAAGLGDVRVRTMSLRAGVVVWGVKGA